MPGRVFVVKGEKHVFLSGCKSEYDKLRNFLIDYMKKNA
jgi:hypothetical protein